MTRKSLERQFVRGFSLVELMIVVGIICVLAGLLLPVLSRAQARAARINCVNSLKQWLICGTTYADDNEGLLPREEAIDGANAWNHLNDPASYDVWYNSLPLSGGFTTASNFSLTPARQIDFYKKMPQNLFPCPAAKFNSSSATHPQFSLVINSKLVFLGTRIKSHSILSPSRTAFFIDVGVPGETRDAEGQTPFDGQPKGHASRFSGRHGKAGNIAFFDGNVKTLPVNKVVSTNGRAIWPGPTEVIWRHDPSLPP